MLEATELKNGTTFLLKGAPYKVEKYRHQKIARGGGNVKLTLRNLRTGDKEEKTLNSSEKLEDIVTVKKPLQYLYQGSRTVTFMDETTYEQVEIPVKVIGGKRNFLKEGEEVDILFWEDRPLSVDLPPKVNLVVESTAPDVKGNSATNVYKDATLENGLETRVPLFINERDVVKIDTRTGEYVERVKKN